MVYELNHFLKLVLVQFKTGSEPVHIYEPFLTNTNKITICFFYWKVKQ